MRFRDYTIKFDENVFTALCAMAFRGNISVPKMLFSLEKPLDRVAEYKDREHAIVFYPNMIVPKYRDAASLALYLQTILGHELAHVAFLFRQTGTWEEKLHNGFLAFTRALTEKHPVLSCTALTLVAFFGTVFTVLPLAQSLHTLSMLAVFAVLILLWQYTVLACVTIPLILLKLFIESRVDCYGKRIFKTYRNAFEQTIIVCKNRE